MLNKLQFQRICRLSNIRFMTSLSHTWKENITFGFSCTVYSNNDVESNLLGRSLKNGCRKFIFHSSNLNIYDNLLDISAVEEVDLNDLYIGHKLDLLDPINVSSLKTEIEIKLRGKKLDFITFPLHTILTTNDAQKAISDIQRNYDIKIGASISTESLFQIDQNEDKLQQLQQHLTQLTQNKNIQLLLYPCNVFTLPTAQFLQRFCLDKNILPMHDDLLRIHWRRPGTLIEQFKGIPPDTVAIEVEKLKMLLDRCLHLEKQYLEKYSEASGVSAKDICWAHNLTSGMKGVLFPEEWAYLRQSQVEPKLTACRVVMSTKSKALQEWVQLHSVLLNQTFGSFEKVLQARKRDVITALCTAISESIVAATAAGTEVSSGKERVPWNLDAMDISALLTYLLVRLARGRYEDRISGGAAYTFLSGTSVCPATLTSSLTSSEFSSVLDSLSDDDCQSILTVCKDLLMGFEKLALDLNVIK